LLFVVVGVGGGLCLWCRFGFVCVCFVLFCAGFGLLECCVVGWVFFFCFGGCCLWVFLLFLSFLPLWGGLVCGVFSFLFFLAWFFVFVCWLCGFLFVVVFFFFLGGFRGITRSSNDPIRKFMSFILLGLLWFFEIGVWGLFLGPILLFRSKSLLSFPDVGRFPSICRSIPRPSPPATQKIGSKLFLNFSPFLPGAVEPLPSLNTSCDVYVSRDCFPGSVGLSALSRYPSFVPRGKTYFFLYSRPNCVPFLSYCLPASRRLFSPPRRCRHFLSSSQSSRSFEEFPEYVRISFSVPIFLLFSPPAFCS